MANLRANNLTGTGGRNAIDGSVKFTASDGYLSCTLDAIGTSDFTIEWWFKAENRSEPGTANRRMFRLGANNATGSISINYDAVNNDIQWNYDATGLFNASTIKVYDNSWYHIAAVREGTGSNETKLYINGVLSDTGTLATDLTQTALQIGWDSTLGTDFGFFGNISNLRVTKRALYTAAFTPPTEKLTGVTDTILLCCHDSDNPTQEATGKTITGHGRYFAATGEKFANTGFTADSDWTKGSGWTIANGLATHAQGSAGDLYQSVSGLVAGEIYKISVDIISTDNDVAYFYIDGYPGGNYPTITSLDSSPVGNHFLYFSAPAATVNIGFRGSSLFAGTITNLRLSSADHGKAPKVIPSVGVDEGVVFEGDTKVNSQGYMYFPTGDTTQRGRGRGLFAGGDAPNNFTITSIEIQSQGNAQDFGDLSLGRLGPGGVGSSTRGVISSGYTQPTNANSNTIDYVTIATSSNATDFGDNTQARHELGSASSETRGLFGGGTNPSFSDVIDYVTIASTGNATDFGNLTDARRNLAGVSSPTRAVFSGGRDDTPASDTQKNILDYVTIASTGNATDFGDLTVARGRHASVCSSTRGVFAGGDPGVNVIDYITIASTGNATDFGDTITALSQTSGGVSNKTRGAFLVGYVSPATTNAIQFVTIATTGNSVDFGDNTVAPVRSVGFSDSHGGLS